jgi:predicted heme/steroid binding protein
MEKHKLIFLLILVSIFLLITNCNSTEPPDDELKPGRRDYAWTVDTLLPPESHRTVPFFISNLWGSSPNDMWAICQGASPLILLWHYDGAKWSLYPQQLGRDLLGIYGFAQNDIWIGDAENSIWHFNGSIWSKAKSLSSTGFDRVGVECIYGISPNNIYAVGGADQFNGGTEYKGVLLHYDGSDWKFIDIPNIRAAFYNVVRNIFTNELVIYGFNSDVGFLDKLFVYDGKNFKEIYSEYNEPGLNEMNGEVYVTLDGKIYKFNNGQLDFWKDFPGTSFLNFKSGRNEKDFFGTSIEGLLHFNGSDLQAIYKTYPKNIELYRVFILENDIFISAFEPDTQLKFIIRGKLKN